MPTETLLPESNSVVAFVPAGGGLTNVECALNDDDTKWNESSVNGARDLYNMRPLPVDARIVGALDLSFRAKASAGTPTCRGAWKLGATVVVGATRTLGGSWTTYTDSGIARPGGGTWTVQNVNDLLAGYETIACSGNLVQISKLRIAGAYSPPDSLPADPDGLRRVRSSEPGPDEPIRFVIDFSMLADSGAGPDGDVSYLDNDANHCITYPLLLPGMTKTVYMTLSRAAVANRPTP